MLFTPYMDIIEFIPCMERKKMVIIDPAFNDDEFVVLRDTKKAQ